MTRHRLHPARILLAAAAALGLATFLDAQDAGAAPAPPEPAELVPQGTCPVSGKALTGSAEETELVYEGQKVRLCCLKCVEKFQDFPDGYLYQLYRQGQKPANAQITCPITGEELGADARSVWVLNKEIRVCCAKCEKKVAKAPAVYLDRLEGRVEQTHCLVSGEEIDPAVSEVIQGQRVAFCCAKCAAKMEADPDPYFAKAAAQKVLFESVARDCPVMEEPNEDRLWWVTWHGRRIHFCCRKCIGRFVKDPAEYLLN